MSHGGREAKTRLHHVVNQTKQCQPNQTIEIEGASR